MLGQKVVVESDPVTRMLSWYRPGTIQLSNPETGRNLVMYEKSLLFRRSELRNKTVLDLGAGLEVKFAKQLKNYKINARVISVSPDFAKEAYRKKARNSFPEGLLVAAVGQALPFRDESFDRIFAFHLVDHLSGDAFIACIREMGRLLKREGKATIGVFPDADDPYTPLLVRHGKILQELRSWGVRVLEEKIPREKVLIRSMKVYYGEDDHCGQRVYNVTCHNMVLVKD